MKLEREVFTKSEKREKKKRPRMKMQGRSLRKPSKYSGMKLARTK